MRTHSVRLSVAEFATKILFVCLLSVIARPANAAAVNGSDASWYTQMVNNSGYTFYTQTGVAEPCLNVLQSVGINAIRLRVWLNPTGGWCNQADTVTKALAAHALGQQVLIDFHYSDTWTSNGAQTPPAAWSSYNLSQMESAVASETSSVLTAIKNGGGTVSWVQCGNEMDSGILFPLGGVNGSGDNSWSNLAGLMNAGYNAVKSVFPSALVVIHLDFGGSTSSYTSFITSYKNAGGKVDVVGMSAYPYWDNVSYQTEISYATATMQAIKNTLGLPSMVCECGYLESDPTDCKSYLTGLIAAANANGCLGVFYWEPECYGNWPVGSNYNLGAFTNGATGYGEPNAGMNAFGGGGGGGNLTVNPGFETGTLSGWSTWTNTSGSITVTTGGHSGSYRLNYWDASAYEASCYQSPTLANGTYTFSAWIEGNSGFTTCWIYANSYGGSEIDANCTLNGSWVQVTIPSINVTSGTCTYGLWAVANAGNWCGADDFDFYLN